LSPEDYGIVGYLQVYSQVMATVLMFGFHGAQTRYFYEFKEDKEKIGRFLFSMNAYLFVVLLFICLSLSLGGRYLYHYFSIEGIPYHPYIPIIIWTVFFQIFNQMVTSYYLASKEYKKCAVLQILLFLGTTSAVIFFVVYREQGALGQLLGLLCGQILFFIFFYGPYARKFIYKFSWNSVKICLAFGIPIVFHLLAGVIHNSIDRVILEKYVSISELGIYTLGYQIGMIMSVITTSVNKAWQPNYFEFMSSHMLKEQKLFENRRMFAFWMIGVGSICLTGMLWAKEFLALLTPEKFHASSEVVPIILFGYLFQGLYFLAVSTLFQFKKTKFLPFITVSSAIVNICLNFIFIPKYGIYGAAYATVISFSFQAFVVYYVSKKLFNPKYEYIPIFVSISFLGFALICNKYLEISIINEFIKFSYLLCFMTTIIFLYKTYTYPVFSKLITEKRK
jgi:O-antigen/teichoic acid export membrane protein